MDPPAVAVERAERAAERRPPGDERNDRRGAESARLALAAVSLQRAALQPGTPLSTRESDRRLVRRPEDEKRKITPEELPPPLRRVLEQVAQGRSIHGLTLQRERRDGQVLHELEFEVDSTEHELKMDDQGKIVESEIDIPIGDLPAAVTAGIKAIAPGATLLEAERNQNADRSPFYEVDIQLDGVRRELTVTEDGRVMRDSVR
jgi:hypothetical protein